jgi:hypothetical protein
VVIFLVVIFYFATFLAHPKFIVNSDTMPLKCKTNTIPISMHQMHISANKVSSVILRPKKAGNPNFENCKGAPPLKIKPNQICFILHRLPGLEIGFTAGVTGRQGVLISSMHLI